MSADTYHLFPGNILSSSYRLVWGWPQLWTHIYLSKPSRHWPLSALSQPASINTPWWACLFQVELVLLHNVMFCFYRRKEKHSQERRKAWFQRVQVRQSPTTICGWHIDLPFSNACSIEHLVQSSALYTYTCRTSGGVAVIHLKLFWVHSCTVSPPLSTTLHTVYTILTEQ